MLELRHGRLLGVVLSFAVLATGCSDSDEDSGQAISADNATTVSPLLAHVPDSTPYVVANTRRPDGELIELMWSLVEPGLADAEVSVQRAREEMAAKDDAELALEKAILSELEGKLNRAGLAELGLDPSGNFALYGLGVLPVLRFEVADGERLAATVARIEAKAGQSMPRKSHGGIEYFEMTDKDAAFIVSIQQNQVVFALVPSQVGDALLPQVLGSELPSSSLAASGRLDQVNEAYGFTPWGTLVMDSQRMVDAILSDDSEAAMTMFDADRTALEPACEAEYRAMAEIAPRIVSGNTRVSEEAIDQLLVVELREDLSTGLAAIKAAIPGLGSADDGLFYWALGIDLIATKQFINDRLAAILAEPYQCSNLAQMNEGARKSQQQMAQPLPPFVANVRGLRVNAREIVFGEGDGAMTIKGQGLVAMNNPQLVLGMAQAFVPELAELQLGMDGEPVALPETLSPVPVDSPYVAMVPDAIGFSLGAGQEQDLKAFLQADKPADPPLISMGYDMSALAAYRRAIMERFAPDEVDDLMATQNAGLEKIDRVTLEVDVDPRGLVVTSSTLLKP